MAYKYVPSVNAGTSDRSTRRRLSIVAVIFNLAVSIALFILGMYMYFLKPDDMRVANSEEVDKIAMAVIVISVMNFLLTALILAGLLLSNRKVIVASLGLMCALLLCIIIISMYMLYLRARVKEDLHPIILHQFRKEYGIELQYMSGFDKIQEKYDCCGVNGPLDYSETEWMLDDKHTRNKIGYVPKSCCVRKGNIYVDLNNCVGDVAGTSGYVYKNGCFDKLSAKFQSQMLVLLIALLSVSALSVVLIILIASTLCIKSILL